METAITTFKIRFASLVTGIDNNRLKKKKIIPRIFLLFFVPGEHEVYIMIKNVAKPLIGLVFG